PFRMIWPPPCLRKDWTWTFRSRSFRADDLRRDNYRNSGNREHCVWILCEGRPFHVAVAGVLDCVGNNNDFARSRAATEQSHAALDRERNRTFDSRRKS